MALVKPSIYTLDFTRPGPGAPRLGDGAAWNRPKLRLREGLAGKKRQNRLGPPPPGSKRALKRWVCEKSGLVAAAVDTLAVETADPGNG
jgi:hypothetical protein